MGKGKRTMIHKILQRKLKIEEHKPEFRSLSEFYIPCNTNPTKTGAELRGSRWYDGLEFA